MVGGADLATIIEEAPHKTGIKRVRHKRAGRDELDKCKKIPNHTVAGLLGGQ
jgi:hypothetical protein